MTSGWSRFWIGPWWTWPPDDLPTFWVTALAAIAALAYVCMTYKLVKNTWKATQAGLLKQILEEYAELAENISTVRSWWAVDLATAIQRYEQVLPALTTAANPRAIAELVLPTLMHESRRKVSQYFLRLRALCEKGMLDADLVAATLGDEPVQVFLWYVDPLDEVVRRVEGKSPKTAEREYFQRYLKKFFPDAVPEAPSKT